MGDLVPIRKMPAKLSGEAQYGYNFVIGGKNRGWILDKDADGYLMYLDRAATAI